MTHSEQDLRADVNKVRNYFDNAQLFAAFKQLPAPFQHSIVAVFKTLPGPDSLVTDAVMPPLFGAAVGASGKDPYDLGLFPKGYQRSGTVAEGMTTEDAAWFHNLDLGYSKAKELRAQMTPGEAFQAALPEIEKATQAVNSDEPESLKNGLVKGAHDENNQGFLSKVSDEVLQALPIAAKAVAETVGNNEVDRQNQTTGSIATTRPNHRVESRAGPPSLNRSTHPRHADFIRTVRENLNRDGWRLSPAEKQRFILDARRITDPQARQELLRRTQPDPVANVPILSLFSDLTAIPRLENALQVAHDIQDRNCWFRHGEMAVGSARI